MMVEKRVPINAPPEAYLVDESDFLVLNSESNAIVQNDLWFSYISRLNSLFAS